MTDPVPIVQRAVTQEASTAALSIGVRAVQLRNATDYMKAARAEYRSLLNADDDMERAKELADDLKQYTKEARDEIQEHRERAQERLCKHPAAVQLDQVRLEVARLKKLHKDSVENGAQMMMDFARFVEW